MNNQYTFHVSVECPDGKRFTSAFVVDAHVAKSLEPYDLCDDSLIALATDNITDYTALRIDTERKQLAQQIAHQLTASMLNLIKLRDTKNGYPKQINARI